MSVYRPDRRRFKLAYRYYNAVKLNSIDSFRNADYECPLKKLKRSHSIGMA